MSLLGGLVLCKLNAVVFTLLARIVSLKVKVSWPESKSKRNACKTGGVTSDTTELALMAASKQREGETVRGGREAGDHNAQSYSTLHPTSYMLVHM